MNNMSKRQKVLDLSLVTSVHLRAKSVQRIFALQCQYRITGTQCPLFYTLEGAKLEDLKTYKNINSVYMY
jgi:hypothetical protein